MQAIGTAITGLWLVFLTYWFVAAMGVKPTATGTWRRGVPFRALLAVGIVLLVRELFRGQVWRHAPLAVTNVNPIAASAGVGVCALGIAIAIWARTAIGRNWGVPMSLREGHELVTTGPYAIVRHPIYSGIFLAILGTALVDWFPWVVLAAVFLAYFFYAARVEERSMMAQFPNEYRQYMTRTKMLIPYLL